MDKDEAFKIAVRVLSKLMDSDNANEESIKSLAFIHTAEAEKDYGKIYTTLEELRKFIVKLQLELKKRNSMARKEEIIASKDEWFRTNGWDKNTSWFSLYDVADAYITGAEMADKTMIDKACEWWENELTYPSMTPEEIKWYKNKINAFRKAMNDYDK